MALDVDALYRTYGPMVMRRCRSILKDEEAAADAMQDTFVRVLRYRDRLASTAPSSLLYTIATNVCLNRLRSSRHDRLVPIGETIAQIAMDQGRPTEFSIGPLWKRFFRSSTTPIARPCSTTTYEETRSPRPRCGRVSPYPGFASVSGKSVSMPVKYAPHESGRCAPTGQYTYRAPTTALTPPSPASAEPLVENRSRSSPAAAER